MQTDKIKKGDDLMLFDSQNKSLAFATSHTLSVTAETVDINCKDTGVWGATLVNKISWEIQSEHLFCTNGYTDLFTKMTARTPITVYFGEKMGHGTSDSTIVTTGMEDGINSPSEYWYDKTSTGSKGTLYTGTVVITSLTLNANSGDNATYSVTLKGVGKLTKV